MGPKKRKSHEQTGTPTPKRAAKGQKRTHTSTLAHTTDDVVIRDSNSDNNTNNAGVLQNTNHSIDIEALTNSIVSKLDSIVQNKVEQLMGVGNDNQIHTSTPTVTLGTTISEGSGSYEYNIQQGRQIQGVGKPLSRHTNNDQGEPPSNELMWGVEILLNASLAPTTITTYKRGWSLFKTFHDTYIHGPVSLPLTVSTIAVFLSYLHHKSMSPKTIVTYLSSISYVHKISGMQDPTSHFLITSLLKGAQHLAPSYDLRLPITVGLLNKMVHAVQYTSDSVYYNKLFTAMFLFAFNAFARCSEIAVTNSSNKNHILQLTDITFHQDQDHNDCIQVTYRFYKHSLGKPHTISFSHGHTNISPVSAMKTYLSWRGNKPGPLFQCPSGAPVTRRLFDKQLSSALTFCGLDSKRYKSHSFRIGKATDCAQRGFSDAKIRLLGRWNSNAFHKYIRNSDL